LITSGFGFELYSLENELNTAGGYSQAHRYGLKACLELVDSHRSIHDSTFFELTDVANNPELSLKAQVLTA